MRWLSCGPVGSWMADRRASSNTMIKLLIQVTKDDDTLYLSETPIRESRVDEVILGIIGFINKHRKMAQIE